MISLLTFNDSGDVMGIALQRGQIANVTKSDKDGSADCRVGDRQVRLHPTLAGIIAPGDNVVVAGEVDKHDVLQAYAMNNLGKGKTARVDSTFFILVMGVAGYVGIMCGVFGLEAIGTGSLVGEVQDAVSIAGLIVAGFALRRMVVMNRASNAIDYDQIIQNAPR